MIKNTASELMKNMIKSVKLDAQRNVIIKLKIEWSNKKARGSFEEPLSIDKISKNVTILINNIWLVDVSIKLCS